MPYLFNLLAEEASQPTTATTEVSGFALFFAKYGSLILLALLLVAMYFLMIRPQKKKQQEEAKMRNNIRVGDTLTTIGGICGRVLNIKEDELVIETGADRSKMTIKKWAVQSVDTVHDTPADDDDDDDI